MGRLRITTPVLGYAGVVGKISFANGEAIVDEEQCKDEVAYCRSAGYLVEEYVEPEAAPQEAAEPAPAAPVEGAESAPKKAATRKEPTS